jgi:hypothetical protein
MPIVKGLKLSELPNVSNISPNDLILLEASGLSRSVEIGVITSGLAAGISGDISGVISAVFDTIISGLTSDIVYISGIVSANTESINTLSGILSDPDSMQVQYNPINYTESTSDISGHYEGIDFALGFLSAAILTGGGGVSGGQFDETEKYLIDAGIISTGSFNLAFTPSDPSLVRIWPDGGGLQINANLTHISETPDYEVSGNTIKINSNSSPSVALNEEYVSGDILTIVYPRTF